MTRPPTGGAGGAAVAPAPGAVIPDYRGACLSNLLPTLLAPKAERGAPWLPAVAAEADQLVLLVLDGLGWEQLRARARLAPALSAMSGGPITSVAPTTTAAALTSISTGLAPAAHGLLGYRVRVGGEVMNTLRWQIDGKDARRRVPPGAFQPHRFLAAGSPALVRSEFRDTGFTTAHLAGADLRGWRMPSTIPVELGRALASGTPLVYVYYDGIDKVAHEWGLGEHYDSELAYTDRLVSDLLGVLPTGAALVVTSDHGQVHVGDAVLTLPGDLACDVMLQSGEGRFRWLHVRDGALGGVLEGARSAFGDVAWIASREEVVGQGWFGGRPAREVEARLGDVALVPFAPVAFADPTDTGEVKLVSRHGALTPAEMMVPLLACEP